MMEALSRQGSQAGQWRRAKVQGNRVASIGTGRGDCAGVRGPD